MKLRVAKKVFNKAISKIKLTKKERLDIEHNALAATTTSLARP